MLKELIAGATCGFLIFAVITGLDITPLLLLGGIAVLFYWLVVKKGMLPATIGSKSYSPPEEISFNNIGGQDTAIGELKEAMEFLLRSSEVEAMGIRPLKGVLLSGPPGTGKTLLAKAAAAYTDAIFLETSGSEFIEMYAGVGAQRVRSLFSRAREMAKHQQKKRAIIFIDELEVLGGKRGSHTSHLEYDQTLNQLLVEMDGLKTGREVQVLIIGATNRADLLDEALLRPGRFDRQVKVELPDREGRLAILKLHTANKPLAADVDLEMTARETFGFSGAHLESVTNEAAILALREKSTLITQKHLSEAVDKVMLGEKLGRKPTAKELYRLAIHEAGHAVVGELLRPGSITHVTITSRGHALGYTRQKPEHDIYLYTRDYLESQLDICLAGAVAETLVLGDRSTGSLNDFKEAVRLSRVIITSGLSELGVIAEDNLPLGKMHKATSAIIAKEETRTITMLKPCKQTLKELAQQLLDKETVTGHELRLLLEQQRIAS